MIGLPGEISGYGHPRRRARPAALGSHHVATIGVTVRWGNHETLTRRTIPTNFST